jgi:hypothetical protein
VIDLPFLAGEINDAHGQVQRHARGMLLEAKRAGEALLAAKKLVKHGEFQAWVEDRCAFSYDRAMRYMRVARLAKVGDLPKFQGGIDAFLDAHSKPRETSPEPAPSVPTFGAEEASYVLKLQAMLIRGSDQEQLTAADKIDAFAARFNLTGEEAIEKSSVLLPNQEMSADDAEQARREAELQAQADKAQADLDTLKLVEPAGTPLVV